MLFLSRLASLLVPQYRPCYPCHALHVPLFEQPRCFQHPATPLEYTSTVYPPLPSPTYVYTREQLLSVKPSPLDPVLTSRLLTKRTSHRSPTVSRTKASGVDFTNLISVPFSSDRPFNAQSVGEKCKRSAINDFIIDNEVDVLCLTETWLLPRGDEAKCSDLSPPGYKTWSFPRASRGGGVAFVVAEPLAPYLSVTADFNCSHSSSNCHS